MRKEMKLLFKGVFMFLISGFYVVFYMMCDYGLYWFNDRFDNFYLIYKIWDVEEWRLEFGKEGIFLFKLKEIRKYIKICVYF